MVVKRKTNGIEIIPAGSPIHELKIGGGAPLALISGPCVIESREHAIFLAQEICRICRSLSVPFVFKASFDKANRTSVASFRGPGIDEGLETLAIVRQEVGVPVLTDVHDVAQVGQVAEVVDVLQIPAFLCRQTDLILAAVRTGKPVNIKKGQFISPREVGPILEKARSLGNEKVMITERGTTFGYNDLVVDFRSLIVLEGFGQPVIYDVTHSLQSPGGMGNRSGGNAEYIPQMARAGVAVGVDALFMEVHDNPSRALSDGPNSLELKRLGSVLEMVVEIDNVVRKDPG